MARQQGAAPMFSITILLGVFASILARAASIGVCYGMSGNDLPSPSTVISLYQANGINSIRLYWPDSNALWALGGTGIRVVVGMPNDMLWSTGTSAAAAAEWVRTNIQAHPTVSFRYIAVGNEASGDATQYLVPAMENIHSALAAAGLDHIKVTTAISQSTLATYNPPSSGVFIAEAQGYMSYVVQFLARTGSPLLANVYPYFQYTSNPGSMDISFALFTAAGTVVQDGAYGYQNLFDLTVDALHTAVAKLGGSSVSIVVSETGWPSAGGTAASVDNAKTYNQNLINHVGQGTPRGQGTVETYLFSMFNENLKDSGVEQNWGLFYPNMEQVYPITFN